MKNAMKVMVAALLLGPVLGLTQNPTTSLVRIKAKDKEVPVSVVESFKKDYNGHELEGWFVTPAVVIAEEYLVTGYDNLQGQQPTFYTVRFKGPKAKGEAMYDKDGKLIHSKEMIKGAMLPVAVSKSLLEKYPGYRIEDDQETIKKGKDTLVHYRVILAKDKVRTAVAVGADGTVLREKKLK